MRVRIKMADANRSNREVHTLRGWGGCPVIENYVKTASFWRDERVSGLRRILYVGTGVLRELESRINCQRSNGCWREHI